jgi:hypothetical protein
MFREESMDILTALKQEREKLQRQLKGIEGGILALNGSHPTGSRVQVAGPEGIKRKRTMSAAGRAKISRLTKERWARFRATKAKKAK